MARFQITAQSGRPPLVNLIMRAAARGELQLTGWANRMWAALITACGWPVTEQTIKDARRRGNLVLGRITTLSPAELDLVEAILTIKPDATIEALAQSGSPAAIAIEMLRDFTSAFDFHRPDLPEPAAADPPDAPEVAPTTPPYSASATSGNRCDVDAP